MPRRMLVAVIGIGRIPDEKRSRGIPWLGCSGARI